MTDPLSASIRGRLLNQAKAKGEEFERTLTRFAAERLLYRIGASGARDRCILKGASLLSVWLPDPYRATRDVDVLAFGAADDEAIRSLVTEICAARCPEDALSFDLLNLTIEPIRPEDEYSGKRARFRAQLGSARIAVQLDIGFGDAIGPIRAIRSLASSGSGASLNTGMSSGPSSRRSCDLGIRRADSNQSIGRTAQYLGLVFPTFGRSVTDGPST